jgi:hypothetical protein
MQDHMERLPLWSDYLVVELKKAEPEAQVFYYASFRWSSESERKMDAVDLTRITESRYDADILLPERAHRTLGNKARIHFITSDWT